MWLKYLFAHVRGEKKGKTNCENTDAFGGFDFVHNGKIAGFHPGLVALIPNLAIAIIGSKRARHRADSMALSR